MKAEKQKSKPSDAPKYQSESKHFSRMKNSRLCSGVALSGCQISYCLKAVGVGNAAREHETVCGGVCVSGGLFKQTSLKHGEL